MTKDPYYRTKEPYYMTKDPYYMTKDPYYMTKDPYHMTKDPYYMTKEPCCMAKEPYEMKLMRDLLMMMSSLFIGTCSVVLWQARPTVLHCTNRLAFASSWSVTWSSAISLCMRQKRPMYDAKEAYV